MSAPTAKTRKPITGRDTLAAPIGTAKVQAAIDIHR